MWDSGPHPNLATAPPDPTATAAMAVLTLRHSRLSLIGLMMPSGFGTASA